MDDAKTTDERLTVLVPCFNEERSVSATVASIGAERPHLPIACEVLMIDDGSTDGTRRVMEEIAGRDPWCRVRVNPRNLGLGRSVLSAYEEIPDGTWVTVMPGDNEFVFRSIHHYMEVRADSDVILGYFQNPVIRTGTRRFASFAFSQVVRVLYGFPYRYLNGLKMYRVECFKGIEVVSGGHAFNAELLAKAILRDPQMRITEVPFVARGRAQGTSRAFRPTAIVRALRDVARGYRSVAEYRRRVIREQG